MFSTRIQQYFTDMGPNSGMDTTSAKQFYIIYFMCLDKGVIE